MFTYILDQYGQPVHEPDLTRWGQWFGAHGDDARQLAQTSVGNLEVSTVFLGLDHGFEPGVVLEYEDGLPLRQKPPPKDYKPVLWETLVFTVSEGETVETFGRRHQSREAALEHHARVVQYLRAGQAQSPARLAWGRLQALWRALGGLLAPGRVLGPPGGPGGGPDSSQVRDPEEPKKGT